MVTGKSEGKFSDEKFILIEQLTNSKNEVKEDESRING